MDGPDGTEKKQRNNFTELVVDLTKISTQYRFNLPPYMVFIIRSLTTLDFCAVRTGANMYEVAAPTALFRALSPRTAYGKQVLERTIMDEETGDIDWQKFLDLSRQASGNSASSTASLSERSDAQDSVEKLGGELKLLRGSSFALHHLQSLSKELNSTERNPKATHPNSHPALRQSHRRIQHPHRRLQCVRLPHQSERSRGRRRRRVRNQLRRPRGHSQLQSATSKKAAKNRVHAVTKTVVPSRRFVGVYENLRRFDLGLRERFVFL